MKNKPRPAGEICRVVLAVQAIWVSLERKTGAMPKEKAGAAEVQKRQTAIIALQQDGFLDKYIHCIDKRDFFF